MDIPNSKTARAGFLEELPKYLLPTIERAAKYCSEARISSGLTYDDLYSVAYMAVLEALPRYENDPTRNLVTLCSVIANNAIGTEMRNFTRYNRAHYRKTENKAFFNGNERTTLETPDASASMQELVDTLFRRLKARDRAIATRYWIKEESATEIGKALKVKQHYVKNRIAAMRDLVKSRAEEYMDCAN